MNFITRNIIIQFMLISLLQLFVHCSPIAKPNKPNIITAYNEPNYLTDNIMAENNLKDYFINREEFIKSEINLSFGSDIVLDENENKVNKIFKKLKNYELENGFKNPYDFTPSRHFFDVIDKINQSKLFQLIEMMPKGGVLHAHDTSLTSINFIINGILNNQKYKDILWYSENVKENLIQFKFSRNKPAKAEDDYFSDWILLFDARNQSKNKDIFDKNISRHFSLYTEDPLKDFQDINAVWKKFLNIFITLDPIVTYAPVWGEYFYEALKEFNQDGVQYLEFRGLLPELYDLDGKVYTQMDTLEVYIKNLNNFKNSHPNFIGAKFIYAPNRKVDNATFDKYMTTVKNLKKKHPDFVAGFDLVSQEDSGNPLKDYIPQLLELNRTNPEIDFFFHAGETNWIGMSTDENLIDAILLDTKRIGHGYALLKHPKVMNVIKEKKIAIEINPISNQVLKLVDDNRNHPCTYLFADNYPIVISSDDPGFWGAKPLSHDFYIAYMGMASAHSDLRFLKQLAINSLEYSSMTFSEKQIAWKKWKEQWNEFITFVSLNYDRFIV